MAVSLYPNEIVRFQIFYTLTNLPFLVLASSLPLAIFFKRVLFPKISLVSKSSVSSISLIYFLVADSIKNAQITHINLNDQTVEGLRLDDGLTFSVQHHPEASPGPTEAQKMFDVFRDTLEKFEN